MKKLLFGSMALLAASAAAFGSDITITFDPVTEVYPAGADTTLCELNGTAPCVVFSGTITDNNTDGSPLFLTGITLSAYGNLFTVDNTFQNDVPGLFEGDSNNSYASNTYTGPIMGLDFAANIPVGTYTAIAQFSGAGGTAGPDANGNFAYVTFTVDVNAPEPVSSGLAIAGLLALAALYRIRRWRRC